MTQAIKEFYLKHKSWVILITITALLFFANLCEPLWIVACVFIFFFYLTCDFGEMVCYTMYFNLFSGIGTYYIYSLLIGFGLVAIKYVVGLIKKTQKFYVLPFVLTTLFVVLFSIIHYEFDSVGFEQGVLVIALLYLAYFTFVYYKTVNVDKCFKFLMIGMACSLVLGLVSLLFDNFGYSIFYFDGTYKRLQLFNFHQNHLSMLCLFSIAYSLFLIVNKKGNLIYNILSIVFCLVLGLFTLSKAFIVVFVGFVVYFFIFLISKYKWKTLKIIIPTVVAIAVFAIVCKDLVYKIFDRFLAYEKTSSLINRITTGRSSVWFKYIQDMCDSIPQLLFGVGLFNSELVAIGPHNVLLYLAYRTGLVGLILLGVLCWAYLKTSQNKIKLTFKNMLPLATFVVLSFNEMIFSDRFAFFLLFAIILCLQGNEKTQSEE